MASHALLRTEPLAVRGDLRTCAANGLVDAAVFPIGQLCRRLTLVRWEFAGCRNPDGGPVEIGWGA